MSANQMAAPTTHAPLNNNPADSPTSGSPPPTMGSPQQDSQTGPVRRKASRRANTAERRATHNAVERQRRETLNGRFLDLAALLPNLASVRRPSKSAIVNSSIVLIHAQRRARAIAGRELRTLLAETDALRREVNEWRARAGAGLPQVQDGLRTDDFRALLALKEEDALEEMGEAERRAFESAQLGAEEDDEDDLGYAPGPTSAVDHAAIYAQQQAQYAQQVQQLQQQQQQQQQRQQQQQPRVAIPQYEHQQVYQEQPMSAISMHSGHEVYPSYTQAPVYTTPPGSSHGMPTVTVPSQHASPQSFLGAQAQAQQQQARQNQFLQTRTMSSIPTPPHSQHDDASSAGSASPPALPFDFGSAAQSVPQMPLQQLPHPIMTGLNTREMAQQAAQGFGWPVQFKPAPAPVAVGGPFTFM